MGDDSAQHAGPAFGYKYSNWNEWFGDLAGGPQWVYFPALNRNLDRERGFLSKADRRLLLETHSLDLTDKSQRNARTRIRRRILSAYFDAQFLQFLSDRDRELIFKNARQNDAGLDFRESFKELVRFSYLGLLEDDASVEIQSILEDAIQEAEEEHALTTGENVNFRVNIEVEAIEGASIETLERRYTTHSPLTIQELSVLVSSSHTTEEGFENAADIDLADALYYDARQPGSGPAEYRDGERNREQAEEIVESLRSWFDEYDLETRDELEETVARLKELDEDLCKELREKMDQLLRTAPYFQSQLAEETSLSEQDTALLKDILWNPDNLDIEDALEKEARPRTAGDEWAPSEDEDLQRFIARVEVARDTGEIIGGKGDENQGRWRKVLSISDFDEQEWSEYMNEQLIERCQAQLNKQFDEADIARYSIEGSETWEEFYNSLPQSEQARFQEPDIIFKESVLTAALKNIQEAA